MGVAWPRNAEWRVSYETDKTEPSRERAFVPGALSLTAVMHTVYLER